MMHPKKPSPAGKAKPKRSPAGTKQKRPPAGTKQAKKAPPVKPVPKKAKPPKRRVVRLENRTHVLRAKTTVGKGTNWKPKFLASLRETANVKQSCAEAGIHTDTAYNHRLRDPKFADEWQKALAAAMEALEAEAYRRAYKGTREGVWRSDKDGNPVMVEEAVRYSDTLTIFLLKAHNPAKYRERGSLELSGPEGGPVPLSLDEVTTTALAKAYGPKEPEPEPEPEPAQPASGQAQHPGKDG